jgi:hypothetical protein
MKVLQHKNPSWLQWSSSMIPACIGASRAIHCRQSAVYAALHPFAACMYAPPPPSHICNTSRCRCCLCLLPTLLWLDPGVSPARQAGDLDELVDMLQRRLALGDDGSAAVRQQSASYHSSSSRRVHRRLQQ